MLKYVLMTIFFKSSLLGLVFSVYFCCTESPVKETESDSSYWFVRYSQLKAFLILIFVGDFRTGELFRKRAVCVENEVLV